MARVAKSKAKNENGNGKGKGKASDTAVVELPSGKLTVAALERYLWSAADILRGSIDSSRLQGLHLRAAVPEAALGPLRGGGREARSPRASRDVAWRTRTSTSSSSRKRARWSRRSRRPPPNVGEALNKACAALEEENAAARGRARRHRLQRRAQARRRAATATRSSAGWSSTSRSSTSATPNLSEPDMLGRAYEYLIEKFADDAGKKGGEFYTPRKVVQLIVELLAPKRGDAHLRPDLRLGRHADRVRPLRRAPRRQPAQPVAASARRRTSAPGPSAR